LPPDFEQYSAARPRFCDVIPSERFYPNGFQRAFNYHSGLWLLLSHITLGQTCSKLQNESIEDSEADNHSEKIDADLCEGCQVSCRFFAFLPISSGTE